MRDLHGPLMQEGVDFWWSMGGSGALNARPQQAALDQQGVLRLHAAANRPARIHPGRYGDWGSERYPAFFTATRFAVASTRLRGRIHDSWRQRAGSYISHDIGGFHGKKIDFDLYARWIEFGTFSPILRMHSAHANPAREPAHALDLRR